MPTHHPHNAPRPPGDDHPEGGARNGIRRTVLILGIVALLVVAVVLIAGGFIG
ncbi:hypothetical protein [Mycolicibacterium diernhoferi]|uniref:hypothetical protein n=1 Tax=Mycolicibacterium diernhoferi TaxID=1801 RepID=UPI0013F68890|nr:hypothetical protein [Mycolicibacterium diernhoferi]QYL21969.1 hypothetical protein K0O62_23805 [Mycolicibacterium diernhoferi]